MRCARHSLPFFRGCDLIAFKSRFDSDRNF
nr:MAG TPA: hypothetical protein [Caudoviricetes sp.]